MTLMSGPSNEALFARMAVDDYFHERIFRAFGVDLFRGVTTPEEREQRIGAFILANGLTEEFINPKARYGVERQTWGDAFERGYAKVQVAPCAPSRQRKGRRTAIRK
jgi:hypothetical protein